tara:strand:- start:262 stop:507 length:246 start_codon:yes stop_codon:yes gene_type:complete
MTKTEKEFGIGYDIGLKAIGMLEKKEKKPNQNHMTGLVSSIMNLLYYYAPTENHAQMVVDFAVNFAKEESKKDKDNYETNN